MSNIQCQLAVSAIATELAPIVQVVQFCYIGKIPKSYVLFRISILVTSYIMKLVIQIIRNRKLLLLIFTCNCDFQLH